MDKSEQAILDRNRHWRWWGAAAGLATGLFDAAFLARLGVGFAINGRDATLVVGGYFGLTFALLGYLVGLLAASRRRDRRAAATIQSQTEELNAARVRLAHSEKLAALGQLAAAIAHEVRNPLAVIRSAAQGLGESAIAADEESRRACAFITTEVDRLNNVITSLLAFARPPQLHPRAVGVAELLDRALLLAHEDLAAKQIHVARADRLDVPAVHADPDLLSQVLLGLLANASAAVPIGGEVALRAQAVDGAVAIEVADSGPGVPPDLREQIFQPFFTTRRSGTGLGLAIARQIIDAHGGRIEVGERAGGGARFTISLPIATGTALAA
ncbi:MAG TPA: ATP-binding protein [Candidatus Binatia bacterium]|nr:ATP-binding protein [Candidatus Binatia bacterium]